MTDPAAGSHQQLEPLRARGLVAQASQPDDLARWLESGMRTVYCGFDPTAGSLHIGHLLPLLMLRRLQVLGHRPIALLGGATGLIGDPSFKSEERSLNSRELVEAWKTGLAGQLASYLDFDAGARSALLLDNLSWTESLDVITFLRDIGKHFSVNQMLGKESVRARIEREGAGISFTEFSYMLLQSYDYLELARQHDCGLQIGGNDQWGNITLGVDLVRRVLGRQVFALTLPLMTRSDGKKFGKTESGTVWLDGKRTSPYAFYQYWANLADADVAQYLRLLTDVEPDEIEALEGAMQERPEKRLAQFRLAEVLTRLVHGDAGLHAATRITNALFGQSLGDLEESDCAQLAQDGVPFAEVPGEGVTLAEALCATGLAKSRGDARRQVASGGVSVNGAAPHTDPLAELSRASALFGAYHLLRRGKKSWAMVRHGLVDGER